MTDSYKYKLKTYIGAFMKMQIIFGPKVLFYKSNYDYNLLIIWE